VGDVSDLNLSVVEQAFGGIEIGGAGQGFGFHRAMMALLVQRCT
jgi:hypothetical protein